MGDHGFMDSMDMTGPAHPELLGAPGITCEAASGQEGLTWSTAKNRPLT